LNEGEEKPHSCKDIMFASISLASAYKGGTSRNIYNQSLIPNIYIYIYIYIYIITTNNEGDVCYNSVVI